MNNRISAYTNYGIHHPKAMKKTLTFNSSCDRLYSSDQVSDTRED